MQHAMFAVPFLLAIGVFSASADQLPAYCGAVGAKAILLPRWRFPRWF